MRDEYQYLEDIDVTCFLGGVYPHWPFVNGDKIYWYFTNTSTVVQIARLYYYSGSFHKAADTGFDDVQYIQQPFRQSVQGGSEYDIINRQPTMRIKRARLSYAGDYFCISNTKHRIGPSARHPVKIEGRS